MAARGTLRSRLVEKSERIVAAYFPSIPRRLSCAGDARLRTHCRCRARRDSHSCSRGKRVSRCLTACCVARGLCTLLPRQTITSSGASTSTIRLVTRCTFMLPPTAGLPGSCLHLSSRRGAPCTQHRLRRVGEMSLGADRGQRFRMPHPAGLLRFQERGCGSLRPSAGACRGAGAHAGWTVLFLRYAARIEPRVPSRPGRNSH